MEAKVCGAVETIREILKSGSPKNSPASVPEAPPVRHRLGGQFLSSELKQGVLVTALQ
jgi:hypothetical protein